jgi:hypothetical protein
MTSDRNKPGVAFWATMALVVALLVAYPLMWGPWWYASARWGDAWAVRVTGPVFAPVKTAVDWMPTWLTERYSSYLINCIVAGKRDRNQ